MKEPHWIAERTVFAVHAMQLSEHGGAPGIRDRGLLESALARPRQLFTYGSGVALPQLATAYASSIARNHPFIDGNKRTAWVVCAVFLERNGMKVNPPQSEIVESMLALAAGERTEEEFAAWLQPSRKKTSPR